MGIFKDLTKEPRNWTQDELGAMWWVVTLQATVDGSADKEEGQALGEILASLPGEKPENIEDWCNKMLSEVEPEVHLNNLSNMHSDKKKILLATMLLVAEADGVIDEKETEFIAKVFSVLEA